MNKSRYIRQIGILGANGQRILADTKILCIGAGGLGTLVSNFLVGAGVRHIGLIDKDTVEVSNLHRQLSYREKDCGQSKVQVLKDYLHQRNSNCQISIYDDYLQPDNADKIVEKFDLIIDCTDSFIAKYLISDLCCKHNKPLISAGIDGFKGQVITISPNMCYRCIFPYAVSDISCINNDVIGPAVGIIASIQVNETIKLITGLNHINQLIQIDTLNNTINTFDLSPDSACINNHEDDLHTKHESHISFITWKDVLKPDINDKTIIIDIRRDQTKPLAVKAIKSDYENILKLNLLKNKDIIIICNHAQASKLAALKLAAKYNQKIFYTKFSV